MNRQQLRSATSAKGFSSSPITSKYKNRIIEKEGVKWSSVYEYECWLVLKDLQKLGKISNLKRQVSIKFEHNGVNLWNTRPDFYFEVKLPSGKEVPIYADAKNSFTAATRSFRTTQKMFKAFYDQEIVVFLKDKRTNIQEAIYKHPLAKVHFA